MKPKPNQKRRTGRAFNGIDKATGYAVRFGQARDRTWSAVTVQPCVLGTGITLGKAKQNISEGIAGWLEYLDHKGLPAPEPEWRETPLSL